MGVASGVAVVTVVCEIFPVMARRAVERQTQYDAEDPRPAPTGIDVFTSTENEGHLRTQYISRKVY